MKKIFLPIFISILACLTACTSIEKLFQNIDEDKMSVIVSSVSVMTSLGVNAACEAGGEKVVLAFKSASEVLTMAVDAENYEPALLKGYIIEKLGNENEYTPTVMLALDSVIVLYKTFYNINWKNDIESKTVCTRFLKAIKSGIDSGVSNVKLVAASEKVKDLGSFSADELTVITE